MPGINRVILIGNLGKDPDTHLTTTGKQVTNFTLAVTERRKTGGEIKEYTEWFNVEAWGWLSDVCQKYLHKGSLIYLEGRLQTDRYEDKEGETKYFTKIVANNIKMLDRKRDQEQEPALEVEEQPAEYEV